MAIDRLTGFHIGATTQGTGRVYETIDSAGHRDRRVFSFPTHRAYFRHSNE